TRMPARGTLRRLHRDRAGAVACAAVVARLLDADDRRDRAEAGFRRDLALRPAARRRHARRSVADDRGFAFRRRRQFLGRTGADGSAVFRLPRTGDGALRHRGRVPDRHRGDPAVVLWHTGGDFGAGRAVDTLLGSALALLAYFAWPTWERGRERTTLANLLDAYANYLGTTLHGDAQARHESRIAARAARSDAQASLDRLRAEPASRTNLPRAEGLVAQAKRMMRAAMLME